MSDAAAPAPETGNAGKTGQRLGPFLCWAVVFADIGTSVYYTPGILFHQPGVGRHAALFVSMTLLVFVLLTRKYAEVAVRFPEGGGVVTVAAHAIHPFAGLLGGMFILVDYFLTTALSGLSGIIYLSDVAPSLKSLVLPVTVGALLCLAALNLVGIDASARVNAAIAVLAAASQLCVVIAVVVHVGPGRLLADLPRVLDGPTLTPARLLTGYAGAFLAFSGLESISQLSPVMAEPRARVTALAMRMLIVTMAITSPLLTLWATTILPTGPHTDPNQFVSLLAGYASGRASEVEVAVSGALLLVFASNTALIGSYHVLLALSRMGFLPSVLVQRNRWRQTPQWAITVATAIPLAILVLSQGSVTVLGDLYAFGLLGAFSLTSASLDIVRWHELQHTAGKHRQHGEPESTAAPPRRIGRLTYAVGLLTTALVALAWTVNLVAKPLATLFGGGVTVAGLVIGLLTYRHRHRRGTAPVLPLIHHPGFPAVFLRHGRLARPPATVLAVLPAQVAQVEALVKAAQAVTARDPIVFLARGRATPSRAPALMEVRNPYLDDTAAQATIAAAERLAQAHGRIHRYLYVPAGHEGPEAVARFWARLQPAETLAVAGDADLLATLPAGDVQRTEDDHVPILRYRPTPPDQASSRR